MANGMKIITPREFQGWSTGARALAGGFAKQAPVWEGANEQFFQRTQELVHEISGDLKRSGRPETHLEGVRVVSTVTYGNDEVDYAQFEINRGGDHDFMGRAWEDSQAHFELVFGRTWLRATALWGL